MNGSSCLRPMRWLGVALTLGACAGAGHTGAEGGRGTPANTGRAAQAAESAQVGQEPNTPSPPSSTTAQPAPRSEAANPRSTGGGGMGGMGGMMGAMTGNAPKDTAAAPQAHVASTATAKGCPPLSQALADSGRVLFGGTGNCFACHNSDATGTVVGPNLADSAWIDIDGSYGAIVTLVHEGVEHPKKFPGVMPPEGGAALDSAQVCAVSAYVYTLGHRNR